MAASYRLARFNLMAEHEETKDFLGLPVPAAAFALVSFIIFCYHLWGSLHYDEVLVSMIVLFAFLMVSQVQYDSFPDRLQTTGERLKLACVLVAILALISALVVNTRLFNHRVLLFPFVGIYILSGMVREFYRLFYVGVGKVTGRPFNRRATDRKD
jgi:CDP-diacylglycerol--serine O-phosphatidyltransferase